MALRKIKKTSHRKNRISYGFRDIAVSNRHLKSKIAFYHYIALLQITVKGSLIKLRPFSHQCVKIAFRNFYRHKNILNWPYGIT